MNVEGSKNALVLFSGGLDSTTSLAIAKSEGYNITALTINYKQRHDYEIIASKKILANYSDINHIIFDIDLTKIGGSALTDTNLEVPRKESDGIPITYVPARNTIFLSIAASYAEKLKIKDIYIGVNAIDYSGYPDCRPDFIASFEKMINLGTKSGSQGSLFKIITPLISKTKSEIIKIGTELGVDYSITVSCYSLSDNGKACGHCDSCKFRKKGFLDAGIKDPTIYQK
ncbi:MAG: 7-cyano-7-deazaguanine synthase QueC [Gammaproteobacteria bacterium]|nr:7-cyano-7-deazaguanine synthase QueC [Gammaproteobacteria bacterium]MBT4462762.1 7-cyano-7-deazaguanine synthase QueC [Gammaproteobacteria bacterium]MBT4654362.1 7-cyano-7-deazaguanine synthase QueC [Gammaproteobacteria bacterium]MBT5761889.1 7-cyano-7-deazaguanine synthase QueC [Gammaproteobacteria bacterium]MBT6331495.1 7-cyano-7-deazaguanine synthase QueC [Gammaproteobacteria bacterium]